MPILKGNTVEATTSERRAASAMHRKLHGPAETINKAWEALGRPGDFHTFRKGFEAAAAELVKNTAGPKELVSELETHGRLLFIASKQMSVTQRAAYARYAHSVGVDVGDDYARTEVRDALIKRFGGARA